MTNVYFALGITRGALISFELVKLRVAVETPQPTIGGEELQRKTRPVGNAQTSTGQRTHKMVRLLIPLSISLMNS